MGRRQEKQLRWRQELLLMQEKEEFNKSLLEPLFLHLKTHLHRCEVKQIYCWMTSKFKVRNCLSAFRQASEYVGEKRE